MFAKLAVRAVNKSRAPCGSFSPAEQAQRRARVLTNAVAAAAGTAAREMSYANSPTEPKAERVSGSGKLMQPYSNSSFARRAEFAKFTRTLCAASQLAIVTLLLSFHFDLDRYQLG